MNDRGIIKWQPFDSLFSSAEIKDFINKKNNIIKKPILSEDQKIFKEEKILEAYHENIMANITIFSNNRIYQINKKILKIIFVNKKILFHDHTYIYFDQIININI